MKADKTIKHGKIIRRTAFVILLIIMSIIIIWSIMVEPKDSNLYILVNVVDSAFRTWVMVYIISWFIDILQLFDL